MTLRTLASADVAQKKVLLRVDFNIPLLPDGTLGDLTRLHAALPTIRFLLEKNAALIIATHIGRPKGVVDPTLSVAPIARALEKELSLPVAIGSHDIVGSATTAQAHALQPGQILMLENIRFSSGEESSDPAFTQALASLADIYVNDAFGCAHRESASITAITQLLPSYAGLLLEKETTLLTAALTTPKRPLVVIIGGAKIDTKIGVLRSCIEKADAVLLGGGLANTFLLAEGYEVGGSLAEKDKAELARELALLAGDKLVLPEDAVCADNDAQISDTTPTVDLKIDALPFTVKILDIGRLTQERYADIIHSAGHVIWNGPVGLYEYAPFAGGTRSIATAVRDAPATTVIGGGDTLDALARFGIPHSDFDLVSTGGGAMLEFLEGTTLPGVAALMA